MDRDGVMVGANDAKIDKKRRFGNLTVGSLKGEESGSDFKYGRTALVIIQSGPDEEAIRFPLVVIEVFLHGSECGAPPGTSGPPHSTSTKAPVGMGRMLKTAI